MPTTASKVTALTIIITTALILALSYGIICFIFLYQRKRYQHQREVLELREAFNKTLLQSKLEIQEQTLDHISKELHANIGHYASLININLANILYQSPSAIKTIVLETKSLAKQLLSELKALSVSLNTDLIMHIGFQKALSNELDRISKIIKCASEITILGTEYRLQPADEIILFRLCQEVLNNIIKYAKATVVNVLIEYSDDRMLLEITDNGIGFDIDMALQLSAKKESTGLLNIKKRARLINAEFSIDSAENKGTLVKIVIPQ